MYVFFSFQLHSVRVQGGHEGLGRVRDDPEGFVPRMKNQE